MRPHERYLQSLHDIYRLTYGVLPQGSTPGIFDMPVSAHTFDKELTEADRKMLAGMRISV